MIWLTKSELADLFTEGVPMLEVCIDTGKIGWASRPAERLFGYSMSGELDGRDVSEVLPGLISPRAGGGRVGLHRDGTSFAVDVLSLSRVSSGNKVAMVLVFESAPA